MVSRKEFGALCGMSRNAVGVLVKRGKLVEDSPSMIDETNLMNAAFLEARKNAGKVTGNPVVNKPEKPSKQPKELTADQVARNSKFDDKFNLDLKKREAEIMQIERNNKLNDIKLAKQTGQVIPTDLVKALFTQHFKSIRDSFKNGATVLLTEYTKRAKLSMADQAALRERLVNVINKAITDGIAESKRDISNIVAEYSQKNV